MASDTRGAAVSIDVLMYTCRRRNASTSVRHDLGLRNVTPFGRGFRMVGRWVTSSTEANRARRVTRMPVTKAYPAQRSTGSQLTAHPQAMKAANPAKTASRRLRAIAKGVLNPHRLVQVDDLAIEVGVVLCVVLDSRTSYRLGTAHLVQWVAPVDAPTPATWNTLSRLPTAHLQKLIKWKYLH